MRAPQSVQVVVGSLIVVLSSLRLSTDYHISSAVNGCAALSAPA
jgi:hypothetical protein